MGFGLSVVIPVWNKWSLTKDCLASLAQCVRTGGDGEDLEVLVVDNGSSDATSEACAPTGQRLFGARFRYLRLPQNRNFAGACNVGAQEAQGKRLFFLNNDTLSQPGWRAPLEKALDADPRLAGVGPLLLYPQVHGFSDRVQHLGVCFGPDMHVSHLHEFLPATHPLCARPRRMQVITAAALCMERALFLRCGGFDEAFVNGFEDVDLCARLHAEQLYFGVEPASRIYHLCGQTPGRADHDAANSAYLNAKGAPSLTPDRHLLLAEDGYRLRLDSWLNFSVGLTPVRGHELERRLCREPEIATARALIAEEPYWMPGYVWLAERLAEERPDEALSLALLASYLFPMPPVLVLALKMIARCGQQARFPHLAEPVSAMVSAAENRIAELRTLRRKLRGRFPELVTDADDLLARDDQFRRGELAAVRRDLRAFSADSL